MAIDKYEEYRNRSMMVHPSRLTDSQNTYYRWIYSTVKSWIRLLKSNDEDEKSELIREFDRAYKDLESTVDKNLPAFSEISINSLIRSMKNTRITEVNARSGSTPEVNWNDFYSNILVGGQAMDRGFTVEGLTVTYMPRSLATGQIDTTLQRARFFGYKKSYLGLCRVWVDQNNIDAFKAIVEHEEDVRKRLEEYSQDNKHLNEWDRELVVDGILRLTRSNVLYDNIERDYFGLEWFNIKSPHDSDTVIPLNLQVLKEFYDNNKTKFNVDSGHQERTESQKHLVAELSLKEVVQKLLNRLKFTKESDSQSFSSLKGIINSYLEENPDETCLVYAINGIKETDNITQKIRKRRTNSNEEIQQLFQGANLPKNSFEKGEIYAGDRSLRNNDKLTVQIHRLNLKDANGNDIVDDDGNILYEDVPTIAIWVPNEMGKDLIRQRK